MKVATVQSLCAELAAIAPLQLAEDWDNVGLLVGDRASEVHRVMTCLTVTPAVVEEARRESVDLIVTHHPLPFKPAAKLTSDTAVGRMLLALIADRVAVYSAHTAFDSAAAGINQLWADKLGLRQVAPLLPLADPATAGGGDLGSGRFGVLPQPATPERLAAAAAAAAGTAEVRLAVPEFSGVPADAGLVKIAIACGSGGSFLSAAAAKGCDALITGEATFHTCLEAQARGIVLLLVGHFASERFAMDYMAGVLADRLKATGLNGVDVFASRSEANPLRTLVF